MMGLLSTVIILICVQITNAQNADRMNGFSLYVSNSTVGNPPDGHLCYKDNISGNPSLFQNISCYAVGRSVVFFNSRYTFVELCYVETYGCPVGKYGENCNRSCAAECSGPCQPDTGTCFFGCKAGWMGERCNKECRPGTYGENCTNTCDGCLSDQCDRFNGTCTTAGKCKPGWKYSPKCDHPCEEWYYGHNCTNRCNCRKNSCVKSTGICSGSCKKGWKGETCNTECSPGHFGFNCAESCDGCISDICDRFDGVCNTTGRCKPGWIYGQKCNQPCNDKYYGHNCSEKCYCLGESCNKSTGKCENGCQTGYMGTSCNQECSSGRFGFSCNMTCDGCIEDSCDRFNGYCNVTSKCKPGWMYGPKCNTSCDYLHYGDNCTGECNCQNTSCNRISGSCEIIQEPQKANSNGAAIGGGIAAVLAVVVVLILMFIFIRRRRNNERKYRESTVERSIVAKDSRSVKSKRQGKVKENEYRNIQGNASPDKVRLSLFQNEDDKVVGEENVYDNVLSEQGIAQYKIEVEDLQKVIRYMEESDGFQKQYEILPHGLVHAHVEGEKEQNKVKNRFLTTWPYDHSRVILKGDTKHDYINASYIDSYQKEKAYIATQGPKKNTTRDFWHMIWQENVGKIVMVTKLEEERRKKCDPYWPQTTNKALVVDNYKLTMKTESEHTVYVYRAIEIVNKTTQAKRTVHHFHFTQWPDHGVPNQIKLANFFRKVKCEQTELNGPMVVHCSAGVGRTGTFIAVDALYENGKKTGYIDVVEYVQIMRKDRMNMIQTKEQYAAVYEVLLELFSVPETAIPAERFKIFIEDQQKKHLPANQSSLRLEFQKLNSLRPSYTDACFSAAKEKVNIAKNATENILAHNKYRLYLLSYGRNRNDYINAVIIPGYFPSNNYLVTQCPLNDTIVDFWTMIHDHDSKIVVLLDRCVKDASLWCDDILEFETLSIEVQDNTLSKDELEIILDHKQKDDKRTVKVFSFSEWMNNNGGFPPSKSTLKFMSKISKEQQKCESSVTVVCRDGCTKSGIFVALSLVLEKMNMDNEIDIFQIARTMQIRRPEFFLYFEQYEYCYQCMKDYFEEDSVYANVG